MISDSYSSDFGDWELVAEIARGGMGVVSLSFDDAGRAAEARDEAVRLFKRRLAESRHDEGLSAAYADFIADADPPPKQ